MTEEELQQRVIETAQLFKWRVHHTRAARTAQGWKTPLVGDRGLPDLVLARSGVVLLAELKGPRGRPTAEQQAWLDALGPHGRLWRPDSWPAVLAELRADSIEVQR